MEAEPETAAEMEFRQSSVELEDGQRVSSSSPEQAAAPCMYPAPTHPLSPTLTPTLAPALPPALIPIQVMKRPSAVQRLRNKQEAERLEREKLQASKPASLQTTETVSRAIFAALLVAAALFVRSQLPP